jgi:hypothetical protein
MLIHEESYSHPTQASRVRLAVFEQRPSGEPLVTGLPQGPGFLLTEERLGSAKVVATLGFFATRDQAMAHLAARGRELERQLYDRVPPAA